MSMAGCVCPCVVSTEVLEMELRLRGETSLEGWVAVNFGGL